MLARSSTTRSSDGITLTLHRVVEAVGCPKSFASVCRLQRRTASAIVPVRSAASCSRREPTIGKRTSSPTTAPSPRRTDPPPYWQARPLPCRTQQKSLDRHDGQPAPVPGKTDPAVSDTRRSAPSCVPRCQPRKEQRPHHRQYPIPPPANS